MAVVASLLRAPLLKLIKKNEDNDKRRDDDRVVQVYSNEAVIGRRPAVNKERQSRQNLLLNMIFVFVIITLMLITFLLC